MTWRGPAVLALLLALGFGAGFGASLAAGRTPEASGVPTPVVALSPSLPVDPAPEYVADPPVAPLPEDLPMAEGRVGTKPFQHVFPVPEGWLATPNNANETKWTDPANPPAWTYLLRVEQVGSLNRTVEQMLTTRAAELDSEEEHVEELGRTADSLTFSYVTDQHLRVGIVRWLRPSGSPFAEVEVAVTGREVDLPGMAALVEDVAAGMRVG